MNKLNIGCGPESRWIKDTDGLDMIDFGQLYVASIEEFVPEKLYEFIYIHHVVEHVTNQIELFNKLSNMLDVNGVLDIRVSTMPFSQAFQDPTHVKYIPQRVIDYFRYFTIESAAGHCYIDNPLEIQHIENDRFEWEAHIIMRKP